MTGWLFRRVGRLAARRLGWVAVASLARATLRTALRRGTADRVDAATAQLEDRLPERVRTVLRHAPGDPVRLGGSAVVAGRSARVAARGAASGAGRAGRLVRRRFGDEVRVESERTRRRLRSRMLRHLVGDAAADDALLDLRSAPSGVDSRPLPDPPRPVPSGRWRAPRRHPEPEVARVQRTYRPPRRPWDG